VDPAARRALSPKEFFEVLPVALASRLPVDLRAFHAGRGRGRLLKVHYGDPTIHFEGWHHAGAGRFEVGLHMESDPATNRRRFGALRARMVEVKGALPKAELEPWDRGWCRLYETFRAPVLDGEVVSEAADRLAAYIRVLQPLVEEIG
jgi:hypothetical protein